MGFCRWKVVVFFGEISINPLKFPWEVLMRPRSLFLLHCLSAHLVDRCGRAAESEQHLHTWSHFKKEQREEKKYRKKRKQQKRPNGGILGVKTRKFSADRKTESFMGNQRPLFSKFHHLVRMWLDQSVASEEKVGPSYRPRVSGYDRDKKK